MFLAFDQASLRAVPTGQSYMQLGIIAIDMKVADTGYVATGRKRNVRSCLWSSLVIGLSLQLCQGHARACVSLL